MKHGPRRDRGKTSLLFSVVIATLSNLGGAAPQGDEAARLLEEAEESAARGRYAEAVRLYRELAEDHPDTEEGVVGARRSRPSAFLGSTLIVDNGPSENRVDVALMGDGFRLDHQRSFDDWAEDVPDIFDKQPTFREYLSYFNFRRFNLVSKDDNVDGYGRVEDTALGGLVLDTIQGHVSVDPERVREMLAEVDPRDHDGVAIVFVRVGGLGMEIRGLAGMGSREIPATMHGWGAAFAGLGDEYSTKTHDRPGIPVCANVSATEEESEVPWAHWLEADVPGIGVYEGANGQVRGAWKPTASQCVMNEDEFFCPPCREAIVLRIYSLVDPIDGVSHPTYPLDHAASLEFDRSVELEVEVMQPATHALEVRWWVLPEDTVPADPESLPPHGGAAAPRHLRDSSSYADRRSRGRLQPIEEKPAHVVRSARRKHAFRVRASSLEPGRYRVICRVRDTTRMRGEKYPWVLDDELGLLESERAWWIRIPSDE